MKSKLYVLLLMILTSGCESGLMDGSVLTDGTYVGVFLRSEPTAKYQPANVTITIQGNRFEGRSSIQNYPAICEGSVTAGESTLTFVNECIFTADFDWSLILNGTFSASKERGMIVLTRTRAGDITDTYHLTLE